MPISILVLSSSGGFQPAEGHFVDAKYQQELIDAGYKLTQLHIARPLSAELLGHFGVVILSGLPYAGEQYQVGGDIYAHLDANLRALRDYVALGGGLIVEPAMSEFGEAYAETYNRFLKPFGAQLLPQQLRPDQQAKERYAVGVVEAVPPIGLELKEVLYPTNVMRWDNAYSTTPLLTGPQWHVVARGVKGAGTYQAVDNSAVGPRLSENRTLFAFRRYDQGYIALSAVHAYYTLSHAYWQEKSVGENETGVINGAVLYGTADGRRSDFGALLDQTYRVFAANSTARGMGGGTAELPTDRTPETPRAEIDWHTAEVPPTWRHRLVTMQDGVHVGPDPALAGGLHYYKILIGPRTALSSGRGTALQYREAALRAGYSAVAFAETFADIDPARWAAYVNECVAASDDQFVCLPGLDIKDFQGGHYLVLNARRFPEASWLSQDRKSLEATRMLSLGWYGHVASVHRSTTDNALHAKMYKHYQAITVYTYDGQGRLVDDSLKPYQWAVASDSNPIPIAAHELVDPSQVARAAEAGFQQIMPGASVAQAVDYFRFAFPHYFECPLRYFLSEGPILDGWSIRNKDLDAARPGHDHFRLAIGVSGDSPIADVKLYDGFELAGRWTPKAKQFAALYDGAHDGQHEFLLLATDAEGRRVLSPGIRTVASNWRLRCGDRQNWLGSCWIYTGWNLNHLPSFDMPLKEGAVAQVPIFDYPFFSNHVQIADADFSCRYVDTLGHDYGGDAKATYAVRTQELIEGNIRSVHFTPAKRADFGVMLLELDLRLKQPVKPSIASGVYPAISPARENNALLILPGARATALAAEKQTDLPIGSYAGGIVPLSAGLRVHGNNIGFVAPPDDAPLAGGRQWKAQYLLLRSAPFHWRTTGQSFPVDPLAETALNQMGFRGTPPYSFHLTAGKLDRLAYVADFTAEQSGIAGTLRNDREEALLFDLPLRIAGLSGRAATVLWRSDREQLAAFDCFEDRGYVAIDADKTVQFYAGTVAQCDPELFVSIVVWNGDEAWFRVNNPTDREIQTRFVTAVAIRGFRPINQKISVPAGSSIEVNSP